MLEVIYVVRHGYRSNWSVDPTTGTYHSHVRTPTGIAADPALASYGVRQAEQLATHLRQLDPKIDRVFSSPYYRCLQTLEPYIRQTNDHSKGQSETTVTIEPGLGEFYGRAPFTHPQPADLTELSKHFDHLRSEPEAIIISDIHGESIEMLHDRMAYCLSTLIARADADPAKPKAMLVCTHAAAIIAIGRVLTGRMPADVGEEDFRCFTCGVSTFVRRSSSESKDGKVEKWSPDAPERVPDVGWRDGVGVEGGWECEGNSDCSFLDGGEERGWNFGMETQRLERLAANHAEVSTNATTGSSSTHSDVPTDDAMAAS